MDPAARVPIELLLEHRAWVQALARALVGDESRADDIAQDAWLAALRHPPRHGNALKAWLGRLVRHRAANARRGESRRAARELAGPSASPSVDPADAVARIEAHERVVRAVLALTEPYRTTVVLRFYEDLSGPEIASRMDVPLETVRTRMKRAFAQLRERLDAEHGGDGATWSIALIPLAWGTGGVVMKTSTKAGLAAAALLLLGSTAVWTLTRRAVAPSAPTDVPTIAAAPTQPVIAPQPKLHDATAAAVTGEVWRRDPEAPAAGVVVRLTSEGTPDRTVVADSRGRFRFDDLPSGTRGTVRVATESEAAAPAAVAPLLREETRSVGLLWLLASGLLDVAVTTLDGMPLAGARVEARPADFVGRIWIDPAVAGATWRDLPDPAAVATTDAAGRATLRGLSRGSWTVVAGRPGFISDSGRADIGPVSDHPPVRLVLAPGAELAGRVEDRSGRPVARVVVRAHRNEGGVDWAQDVTTPRATTGADGRFALTGLPEGAVALSVARRGEPPTVVGSFRVPTSSPVRLVVGGPTIAGQVIDAASGAPIPGARVRAHSKSWIEAVSDEHGAFVIASPVDHLYVNEIRVEKSGYVVVDGPRSDLRGLFSLRGDENTRLDLKMRRAEGLRGTVSHDHAPVRGARVAGLRWGILGFEAVATTTDGDGRYLLDGVAGTTVLVEVDAPPLLQPEFWSDNAPFLMTTGKRHPKWSVDVPAEGGATLDVELVAGDDVTGRVLGPGGAPIEGALVDAGQAMTYSAMDGGFALHGVDLRWASVSATKRGFVSATQKANVGPITLRLAPLPVVRGTVRAEGGPLDGGWVEWAVKPVDEPTYYMRSPDYQPPPVQWDGRRAPVAADGTFEISVAAGTILARAGGRGHGPSAPVEVTVTDGGPAPEATIDVAAVVTIHGRVVSQDGVVVPAASVELDRPPSRSGRDDGRPAPGVSAANSDADGRFEIPSATPGAHRVFVDADGFLPATVDVAAASEDVVVRLAPAAEIRGTVVWNDGRPVESAMVTVFPKGMPSPFGGAANGTPYFTGVARHGAFRIVVPPGTYTAYVSASGNNVSVGRRTFEDVAAGASDVKFVIDVGPVIAGRVVGADDGAPLAGARVGVYVEGGKYVTGVTSDEQGRFKAEAADAGPFAIVALSASTDRSFTSGFVADKRYLRGVAHGVNAGAADVEVRLPVGADIAGSLIDASGAPVVGRWVVAHRLTKYVDDHLNDDGWRDRGARTDASGRFVVTGLVVDSYRLFAADESGPRRTPLGGGESVTTGARDVRVVLPGTATISGRVVDETGAPFNGVSVSASPADKATWNSAETRPDGTFEIVGVADFGTYTVSAQVNNRAPIRVLDVAPGATGIQLKVARGRRASGRLLDASGKPLARATLVFRTENNDKEAQAVTDADGRFTMDNLLPGAYRMENFIFQAGKGVYLPVGTLKAGDENVELRRAE